MTATALLMWCVPSVSLLVAIDIALGPSKPARSASGVESPMGIGGAEAAHNVRYEPIDVQFEVKGTGAAAA